MPSRFFPQQQVCLVLGIALALVGWAHPLVGYGQGAAPDEAEVAAEVNAPAVAATPPAAKANYVYDAEPEIATLSINNTLTLDVEFIAWPDGSVSLPVKYLAEQLEVTTHQPAHLNTLTLSDITQAHPIVIDIANQRITQGSLLIDSLPNPIYRVPGSLFMENEIFLDAGIVKQLLDITIGVNTESYTIAVGTERALKAIIQLSETDDDDGLLDEDTPATHLPETHDVALDVIELNVTGNAVKETHETVGGSTGVGGLGGGTQTTDLLFHGMHVTAGFHGHVHDIEYDVTPTISRIDGQSGMTRLPWQLRKDVLNHPMVVGEQTVGLTDTVMPSMSVWGANWGDKRAMAPRVSTHEPPVITVAANNGKHPVQLWVNGLPGKQERPRKVDSPQGPTAPNEDTTEDDTPRYTATFDNLPLAYGRVNEIRVTQVDSQGTEHTLYEQTYPLYQNVLPKGEHTFNGMVGRVTPQFRPPNLTLDDAENPEPLFMPQSNKWLAGARYYRGLTDKLTVGVAAVTDTIVGEARTNAFSPLLLLNQRPDLTGYVSRRRDPNLNSGSTVGVDVRYQLSPKWQVRGNLGVSQLRPAVSSLSILGGGMDAGGELALTYKGRQTFVRARAYHYGPKFYTPTMSDVSTNLDRRGIGIEASGKRWGVLYYAGLDVLQTNLGKALLGGPVGVKRLQWSLQKNGFKGRTNLRLSGDILRGENTLRQYKLSRFSAEVSHRFHKRFQTFLNYRRSSNTSITRQSAADGSNIAPVGRFLSGVNGVGGNNDPNAPIIRHTVDARARVLVGKRQQLQFGAIATQQNKLGTCQMDLHWGKWRFTPFVQKSFGGNSSLLSMGTGIHYEFETGRYIGLQYSYTKNLNSGAGGAFGGGTQTQRTAHQFNVNLTDAFVFAANRLKSIGRRNQSNGILYGNVFLDLNRNGKQDDGEPPVPNIQLMLDRKDAVAVNNKGQYFLRNLHKGKHRLAFDFDNLPINITPTTETVIAKIDSGKLTHANFGIIVTPGNISGNVVMHTASGQAVDATDVVVVLTNKATGKEVKFTYARTAGAFDLTDIAPGDYELSLDKQQSDKEGYKLLSTPAPIHIPIEMDDFVDITDVTLKVLKRSIGT